MSRQNIKAGLVEFRPDRAEALASLLPGHGITPVVFHTRELKTDSLRMASIAPHHVARALTSEKCDIYIAAAWVWPALISALSSMRPGSRSGCVLNAWIFDESSYESRSSGNSFSVIRRKLYPRVYDIILDRASVIICNSNCVADSLNQTRPALTDKIRAIHNGIDFDLFEQLPKKMEPSCARVFTSSNANEGTKIKGLLTVIDAFGRIAGKHPGATLTAAVTATNVHAEENMRQIEKAADKSGCRDRIELIPNARNMPELYSGSYVFAYCTPHRGADSLPRVLLEAQCASVPVVAGNESGCPEAIKPGATGLLTENSPAGLAGGIDRLMSDATLRNSMAAACGEWIKTEFSWEKMADGYADAIREALEA